MWVRHYLKTNQISWFLKSCICTSIKAQSDLAYSQGSMHRLVQIGTIFCSVFLSWCGAVRGLLLTVMVILKKPVCKQSVNKNAKKFQTNLAMVLLELIHAKLLMTDWKLGIHEPSTQESGQGLKSGPSIERFDDPFASNINIVSLRQLFWKRQWMLRNWVERYSAELQKNGKNWIFCNHKNHTFNFSNSDNQHRCELVCSTMRGQRCGFQVHSLSMILFTILSLLK